MSYYEKQRYTQAKEYAGSEWNLADHFKAGADWSHAYTLKNSVPMEDVLKLVEAFVMILRVNVEALLCFFKKSCSCQDTESGEVKCDLCESVDKVLIELNKQLTDLNLKKRGFYEQNFRILEAII